MDQPAPTRRALRLLVEDVDDLQVISAALQDALSTVGEIEYDAVGRRLTIALNRFCWECSEVDPIRIRAGLQLGGVLNLKSRDVKREARETLISILAVTFEPNGGAEDPGGAILIHLACGGDLRAEVECVDAVLTDLSEPWSAKAAPAHKV